MDQERVMARQYRTPGSGVNITLGGQRYEIFPLPIRQEKAWRAKLAQALRTVKGLVDVLGSAAALDVQGGEVLNALLSADGLPAVLEAMPALVEDLPDIVLDLVVGYANGYKDPDSGQPVLVLPEDIGDRAYSEEIYAAFWEVLKLAYPFVTRAREIMTTLEQMGAAVKANQN